MRLRLIILFIATLFVSAGTAGALTPPPSSGTYVALGDSIAAGYGLNSTLGCGRSDQAYPYQVAQAKNLGLRHLACSGATTRDVLSSQLPKAFEDGTPRLITITIGANDMNWASYLRKCVNNECGGREDGEETKRLRTELESQLKLIFDDIRSRSGGNPPRVVVTGYSNPISNYCKGRQSYVSNKEINWLNKQRDALNKTIRKSMKGHKNVRYASTNFNGHALCAADSWVQGINDRGRLHPNDEGQTLIAKSVIKKAR